MCDGRVQKLEEEQADVRSTLIGAGKAEVGVQARLCERKAESVEQNDGLELHERHVLDAVAEREHGQKHAQQALHSRCEKAAAQRILCRPCQRMVESDGVVLSYLNFQ